MGHPRAVTGFERSSGIGFPRVITLVLLDLVFRYSFNNLVEGCLAQGIKRNGELELEDDLDKAIEYVYPLVMERGRRCGGS